MIGAIGAEKEYRNRQVIVERLFTAIGGDKDMWTDVMYIFSSVLGAEKLDENIDLRTVVEEFRRSWKYNKLGDTMIFCGEIGILSKKDIANMLWVVANWRSRSGAK